MLSALFGKNSDSPLTDRRHVQELIDDLPKSNAIKALSELSDYVRLLSFQADAKADDLLAALNQFDEAAQPHVNALESQYFTPFEINKFQEYRLWFALSNWASQIADAYFKVFASSCEDEKPSSLGQSELPLLAARTVYSMRWHMKYVYAHYGHVHGTIWDNLARLYVHAERYQYHDTPVTLYPGAPGSTTVKAETGALVVWFDCGPRALTALNSHLVERLLSHYRSRIEIYSDLNQNCRLSFALTKPSEPTRVDLGHTLHPAIRFFGMPTLQAQLEALVKVLEKGIVPDEINLNGSYHAEVVDTAAQYLLNYVASPPIRRSKRHLADVTLSVVQTLDRIAEVVSSERISGKDDSTASWVTDEISTGGFSATIPAKGNGGIGIGALLGIRARGRQHWGVAVIRRMHRDEANNRLRVGAEVFSNQVSEVVLNQNRSPGGTSESGLVALWLYDRQDDANGEIQLLMKAGTFSPGRSLLTQLFGKNYLLLPASLKEKGLGYDLARFRFVVQESGAE
jgi:hypothetical protein